MRTALVVATILLPGLAAGQPASGTITGTVQGPEGEILAGARLEVTSRATGATRVASADTHGRFIVSGLAPGLFEVTARSGGLAPRRQEDLRVEPGRTLVVRFELTRAADPNTLTIGLPPMTLEPARTHLATTITRDELDHLPLAARNVFDTILLTPATTRRADGSSAILGQPATSSDVTVDGARVTPRPRWTDVDRLVGTPFILGADAVDAVRVNTTGYSAEQGRSSGASVNIVTRNGSNTTSGRGFYLAGDDQFGGSLSGPLQRDRHFIFGNYEGLRWGSDDLRPRDQDLLLVRTDHVLSSSWRAHARYNQQEASWGLSDVSSHAGAIGAAGALGPRVFTEARLQAAAYEDTGDGRAPLERAEIGNTVSIVAAGHLLRAGGDVQFTRRGDSDALPNSDARLNEPAAFIQDQWHVSSSTTVTLGMRYDAQRPSLVDDTSRRDWSPRAGFAWAARPNVVLRGGYGLFSTFGMPEADPVAQYRPDVADVRIGGARVQQASAGFDWEWTRFSTVGASYIRASATGGGDGRYDALVAQMQRRYAGGGTYRVAYTLARSELAGLASPDDARHRLVASAIYDTNLFAEQFLGGALQPVLTDFTLSVIYVMQSGLPALDGRTARTASLNPRVARNFLVNDDWRLQAIWEAFDLTEAESLLSRGRTMRLGARLIF